MAIEQNDNERLAPAGGWADIKPTHGDFVEKPYPSWQYRERKHEQGVECFCPTCRAANRARRLEEFLARREVPDFYEPADGGISRPIQQIDGKKK